MRVEQRPAADGYLRVHGPWQREHELVLELGLDVQLLEAHPRMRANAGKVCLRRGPLVYCLEQADNGANLSALSLDLGSELQTRPAPDLAPGALAIVAKGWRRSEQSWEEAAYRVTNSAPAAQAVELVAVPYYLWGNRGVGEMSVWVRRHAGG